jgi:hypothetical protein
MTRPEGMKTKTWALCEACARVDVSKVKALLAKDRRPVNAQFWYRFPIHMAVSKGSAEIVELLLEAPTSTPGSSNSKGRRWLRRFATSRGAV